jgi:very-short-patch-repair endonuclease
MKQISALEEKLAFQIKAYKLPLPERQFRFIPGRQYRADFAWPNSRLLVELEGGVFSRRRQGGGWHQSISGYIDDCRKYNIAALNGFHILRYTAKEVESGLAIEEIDLALRILMETK